MRKRGLAALLAFALTFTTVLSAVATELPEGIAETETGAEQSAIAEFQEGSAETTEEVQAERLASEADSSEKIVMVEEAPAAKAMDNEEMIVDDEFSDGEIAVKEQVDAMAEEEPVDAITGEEPQIVIEDSEIVDMPVMLAEADSALDIEKISCTATTNRVHVLHVRDFFDDLMLTVNYKNGEEESIYPSSYGYNEWSYYLSNGQTAVLKLPEEALNGKGFDSIGIPGTYTATLTVGEIPYEDASLAVEIYGGLPETLTEMNSDLSADLGKLESGAIRHYTFTPQASGLYVVNNPADGATDKVYQIEDGEYIYVEPQYIESSQKLVVSLTAGKKYLLYVYNSNFNGYYSGTIHINLRKTPMTYTLDAQDVYNAAMAVPEFEKNTLTITYDDNSIEILPGQWGWWYSGGGPDHFSHTDTSQNGDTIQLCLKDANGELVGVPYDNYVPLGMYRLCVDYYYEEESDSELASKNVTFAIPEGTQDLTLDASLPYQIEANAASCYYFHPQETGDYTFNASNANVSVCVYKISDSHMDRVSGDSVGYDERTSFYAEAGTDYLAVVRSYSETAAKGKVSIRQKKSITEVTINAKSSYNMFELEKALNGNIEVGVLYEGETQPEIIADWDEMYGEYFSAIAENGDEVRMSLWQDGEMVFLPEYEDIYPAAGTYTLKVSALSSDSKEIVKEVNIEVTDPEYVDTLVPGKEYSFTVEQNGISCYKLGTISAGPCRIHIKESDDRDVHSDIYRVADDGFRHVGAGTFEAEEGEEYVAVLYAPDYTSLSGTLTVEVPVAITGIAADLPTSQNALEVVDNLMTLPVTVTYSDTTEEVCSEWEETGMGTYWLETDKGDYLYMFMTSGADEEIVELTLERIPLGTYQLHISDDGPVLENSKFSQSISIKAVTADNMPESLAIGGNETAVYSIPALDVDKVLKMTCVQENSTANGGYLGAMLYQQEEDAYKAVAEIGGYRYENYLMEGYSVLEKGQEYLLCLKSNDTQTLNVSLQIYDKKTLRSTEMQSGLAGSLPQNDALDILFDTKVNLTYEDGTAAVVGSWAYGWNETIREDVLSALSANGEKIVLALYSGEKAVDLPWRYDGFLDVGDYTLHMFVDGEEKLQTISFQVTELEVEVIKLDTEALPGTVSANRNKCYTFTPDETGEYAFGICAQIPEQGVSIWASVYDDEMHMMDVDDQTPYDLNWMTKATLQAGRTYYYKISCMIDDSELKEVAYTVTLEKPAEVTGIRILNPEKLNSEELTYPDGTPCGNVYINDLRAAFTYSNGKTREVKEYVSDMYGNKFTTDLYSLGADGKPDLASGSIKWGTQLSVGKYAYVLLAGREVPGKVEDGIIYLDFEKNPSIEPAWIEISVVADHDHEWSEWVTTEEATCTTNGEKIRRCTVAECEKEETESLPALGHSWGEWKTISAATTSVAEQQERECSRCHLKETQYVGSPLPSESETPGTEVPKTGNPESEAPILKVPETKVTMQKGQSTTAFTVTMSKGDSVLSVESSNKKILTVSKINKTNGTFKLKAKKKSGKVKLTIKLASGLEKTVTVNVQAKKVVTKKITGVSKKLSLKKKQSYTLKPVLKPVTTQDKLSFASSNKKVATVSKNGVIKAKSVGKATITITSGAKKFKCKITVK